MCHFPFILKPPLEFAVIVERLTVVAAVGVKSKAPPEMVIFVATGTSALKMILPDTLTGGALPLCVVTRTPHVLGHPKSLV